jgi:GGDEF domain-containing protein
LSAAAADACDLTFGGVPDKVLEPVARAMRLTLEAPLFAPIGIVGDEDLSARFRKITAITSEPLKIASHLDGLLDRLSVVPWGGLLVPVEQVAAAVQIADGAPVIGWGESRDWAARLRAVEAGASGFVSRRCAVAELLDQVRSRAIRPEANPEIFVIADESPAREAWVRAMKNAGMGVVASCQPHEIAPALDVVCPDVLVVGGTVGKVDAEVLVRACRSHGRRAHVPVVVVGDVLDGDALRAAGADDVLSADVTGESVADRVAQRNERMWHIRRGRHAVSGLLDRPFVLRQLDRRLGSAQRDSHPLTVAVLGLSGLGIARERWGKAAVNAAQQLCAEGLEAGVRRIDLAGQLGADTFLLALHRCAAREGRRRMTDLARRIELRLHSDHRLRELICLFGIADSEDGLAGVAVRADDDLRSVRRIGHG